MDAMDMRLILLKSARNVEQAMTFTPDYFFTMNFVVPKLVVRQVFNLPTPGKLKTCRHKLFAKVRNRNEIVHYPHPSLRHPGPLDAIDKKVRLIVGEMLDLMYEAKG